MTDPLEENNRNPPKNQENSALKHIKYNNNKHNMLVLHKRWKKYDEFQLTKNKMDLNNRKSKIIHPPPSEESNNVTDPWGKTVE